MPNTSAVHTIHDIGVAKQIGKYSDAVEVPVSGRLLLLSGTPGLTSDGHLPETFEAQAEQAWKTFWLYWNEPAWALSTW